MEFLQLIKNRRSIRNFQEKEISQAIVDKLIEALLWAPSAGNLQSRKFYFVFNKETKKELAGAALGQDFIARAPLIVVGCSDNKIFWRYDQRGKNLYSICDVACSIENLMLVAYTEGLGSCWVGAFSEKKVVEILNLPRNLRPIVICPLGYPEKIPEPSPKVPKEKAIEIIK
jgi:nitroreductase